MAEPPGGLIRPYQSRLALLFRLFDGLWVGTALWLIIRFFKAPWTHEYGMAAISGVTLFYFFAEYQHLYGSWRGSSLDEETLRLSWVWFEVALALIVLAFATKTSASYSRRIIIAWFIVVPVLLTTWRMGVREALRVLRAHGYNTRVAVIAGAGALGVRLGHILMDTPWAGIHLLGFYDDEAPPGAQPIAGRAARVQGTTEDLVRFVQAGGVDLVYVALPMRAEARMRQLVTELSDTRAAVCVVPDVYVSELLHARWMNVGGIPVVSIYETPFDGVTRWIKRVEDLLLSSLILPCVAIPMLVIGVAVRLSSPGPIIFRQRRYGLNGEVVEVLKFRTMTVCEDGDSVPQATLSDSRVTRLGAFLRRTSLDELPQLLNVLAGSMSVVGPRPHAVAHNEQFRRLIPSYMLRHKVKPGMTGWAQVNGWRGETDTLEKMQKRVEYDLEYIREWSLWLDLKILFLTAVRGFVSKHAY